MFYSRLSFCLFLFFTPAAICRVWLLHTSYGVAGWSEILGFAYDLLFATILAGILSFVSEYRLRVYALIIFIFTVIDLRISYEFALVFGYFPELSSLKEGTDSLFLKSTIPALNGTPILNLLLISPAVLFFSPWYRYIWRLRRGMNAFLIIVLGVGIAYLTPRVDDSGWRDSGWRTSHPSFKYFDALHGIFRSKNSLLQSHAIPVPPSDEVRRLLTADLDGEPNLKSPKRAKNVLLILVEGFTGYNLRENVGGLDHELFLPKLHEVTKRGWRFTHFISHQRTTYNGLYSILCGDITSNGEQSPKFYKVSQFQSKTSGRCLPRILEEQKIKTHYLQATKVKYMNKDNILPSLGFSSVEGLGFFNSTPGNRIFWGVDDEVFFEGALRKVNSLDSEGHPWFLTLQTVGTHHPFGIPKSWEGYSNGGKIADAFHFLDDKLSNFILSLEKQGVLDDTLVLITGDESIGSLTSRLRFDQNWGGLLVLEPRLNPREITESFSQMDISISILDYLGIEAPSPFPIGRSIFRDYKRPRTIVFANYKKARFGMFDGVDKLVDCHSDFSSCTAWRYPSNHFLWLRPSEEVEVDQESWEMLDFIRHLTPLKYRKGYSTL